MSELQTNLAEAREHLARFANAPLHHVNASPIDPAVEACFGQEVRDLIAEHHAEDFEVFGFER